ncbi:hypothetical protein DEU56DRAFT_917382 [Suillus clintonianus]|uniref:uncharacterized protein n=1 Tax=Suillus clintonianus TaxID=1904413 RepID=UPI001B861111|nr:uncharacterized protein DEU56DRAFT_917382 [Suillus clintonianus]KAG2123584.1 hypothetical protein DEU56DRAFT_917382 [Suillus clintonianus]
MRWHTCSQALALLLLVHSRSVVGIDWNQCFTDITANAIATNNLAGLLNLNGDPVSNISDATGISYSLCISFCGSGLHFQWSAFSQDFSSWLLPYLALISQLPFGAQDRFDNLMSALLTVGSPVLAGYSLIITLLNSRWINRQFRQAVNYPNSGFVVSIVSSLQQVPLGLHSDPIRFASLVILPENDCWWKYFSQMVDYSHSTWSIASGTSIVWVVVSYILSITSYVQSSTSLSGVASNVADGGATGSMWLWLISIVVGWLLLSPKCDFRRLQKAYDQAGQHARAGIIHAHPPAFTEKALTITAQDQDVVSPDELLTPPVFNYSRSLQWASTAETIFLAYKTASEKAENRIPVHSDSDSDWVKSDDPKSIHPDNRLHGSNEQIIAYCAAQPRSRWAPGVFTRMAQASCASLALQWGTVGGAIVIEWFTPTIGMGCRSLGFLVYGVVSTVIWIMLLTSSILAHYSAAYSSSQALPARIALAFSHLLRRMGKLLAIANSIWVIMTCVFQYSYFYDTCYCDSSMISRGRAAGYVTMMETTAQVAETKSAWIGGLVLACTSAAAFVIFVSLFMDTLKPEPSA